MPRLPIPCPACGASFTPKATGPLPLACSGCKRVRKRAALARRARRFRLRHPFANREACRRYRERRAGRLAA